MITLQPIVRQKLLQFRRRRNCLLMVKGLAAAIVAAAAIGIVFVAIDGQWSLSDSTRWMMAGVIYLASAAIVGIMAVGPCWRGRSLAWLASMFEQVEPRMKDRLRAALELSDDFTLGMPKRGNGRPGHASLDSADFRAAVQQSAAQGIQSIDIATILPWRLVQKWLSICALVVAAIILLSSIPDLYFANRLGRILLPMANLDRVSKYAIEILQPSATHPCFPEESSVSVEVAIRGGLPSSVVLESESGDGSEPQFLEMHLEAHQAGVAVFHLHWAPALGVSRYRVVAEDAATAWHSLEIRQRPQVEGFEIEYRYPTYTQTPAASTQAEQGNLEAIAGTTARLSIATNQRIAQAELRMQAKDRSLPANEADIRIPMLTRDGKLTAEVPIDRDATYRIDLIAAETQFTNTYSPRYDIHAIPDRPPTLRWRYPTEPSLAVQPNQILDISVAVEDELPIASLVQQLKTGSQDWTDIAIPFGEMAKQELEFFLDLAPLDVAPGDTLQTRIVATDRKNQTTTSSILELFISSMSLDPNRQSKMLERVELARQVEAYHVRLEEQAASIKALREEWKKIPDDQALKQLLIESIQDFATTAGEESKQLRQQISQILPKIDDAVSAAELELMAQTIARLETERLPSLQNLVDASTGASGDSSAIEPADQNIQQWLKTTAQMARRTRDFVSHDVLSQVGQDLSVLLRYQQELKNSLGSILPEQYRRRQLLVARQMQELSELIRQQIPILRNRSERPANQWSQWLETQALEILEITGKDDKPLPVQEKLADRERLAGHIEQELLQHQNAGNIDSGLPHEQLQARKELHSLAGAASRTIETLAQAVVDLSQPKHKDELEAKIDRELIPAIEQLAIRRELQQTRHDGDNQYVADLGEAYRATQSALPERRDDPKSTAVKLAALHRSLVTLEAIHELQQASKTLEQLHSTERWKSNSLEAHFEQPRVWEAFEQQLAQSVQSLANAKLPRSVVDSIRSVQQHAAVERIESKIGPRRWTSTSTASAAQDIEELQLEVRDRLAALAEIAQSARKILTDHTPTVPDLAREAAERIRQASAQTKLLTEAVAKDEVPDTAPRIEQLQAVVEANEPALQQLREALADVASRQDLMQQSDARVARDADTSVAITHDVQKRIRQSFEDIQMAEGREATRLQLDQSAIAQSQAAESLDRIASHFEALGQNPAKGTPSERAPSEPISKAISDADTETARPGEMEKAHDEAERLRRLANLDPKRVLEQLEKELVRNKPMQTELSEIARDAVDDALKTLEFTALRERELSVGLENSDFEFSKQKESLRTDVQRVAKSARYLADQLAPRIQSTADQAQSANARQSVQRLRDELYSILESNDAVDSQASIDQIVDSAKKLEAGLESFRQGLRQQATELEEASEKPIAIGSNQRRGLEREMSELQSRYRDEDVRQAFAIERNRQQEVNQADQELKKAERNMELRTRERAEAQRRAAKQNDSPALQQAVENQEAHLKLVEMEVRWAQQTKAAAETRQKSARAAREQLQLDELVPPSAPNPAAWLGNRIAAAAAKAAEATADELRKSFASQEWIEQPNAAIQALRDATLDQEALKQDIENAADSLARAARHEQRLENSESDAMISEQAAQVAAIATGVMQQARDQLESSANTTDSASSNGGMQASSQATRQSQHALQAAEQALLEQAASLRTSSDLGNPSSSSEGLTNNPSKSSDKNDSLLSPQEMARMLDELDQQLNSPPKDGESQGTGSQKSAKSSSPTGQPSKSSAPGEPSDASAEERAQTLADAAQRLASEMNQQRQAMENAAKTMPETGAPDSQSRSATEAGKSSSGIVLPVEIENLEDWGKLRQQSAENTVEANREALMPAYRQQIEEYFRILSKRQLSKPSPKAPE